MANATSAVDTNLPPNTPPVPVSKKALWTGRVLSMLVVLLLVMSGIMKLIRPPEVMTEFARLGYPEHLALAIGILELACAILYAFPQSAVLGAILLTAYLGGATATHVRVGDPFIGPVIVGVVVWIGLYLREPRLRPIVPWRR